MIIVGSPENLRLDENEQLFNINSLILASFYDSCYALVTLRDFRAPEGSTPKLRTVTLDAFAALPFRSETFDA